ncbi:hypothetical protein M3Y97_01124000 [Aphelenchoides bicaudatus]|nr:hypothetical protein M3Y97_01124000 [Aphelenchoides bicaudatus]
MNPLVGWKFQQLRKRKAEEAMSATAGDVIDSIELEQKRRRDAAKLQQKVKEEEPEIIDLTDEPILQSTNTQSKRRHQANDVKPSVKPSSSVKPASSVKASSSNNSFSAPEAFPLNVNKSTSAPKTNLTTVPKTEPKTTSTSAPKTDLTDVSTASSSTQKKKESTPKIAFYNDFVKTLPIFEANELDLSNTVLKSYTFKNKSAKDKMIKKMTDSFEEDLMLASGKHYWFIFEEPFHKCNKKTFEKGHASVSLIPPDFHITLLPEVLQKIDLKSFGVKYAVLNITSNWLTRFNPDGLNAGTEYINLVNSLKNIFEAAGLRRVVILTCPLKPCYNWAGQNLHNAIHQQVINMKKQRKEQLVEFENYSHLLETSKLTHGEEAFRFAMKTINNKYFVD